MGNIGGNVLVTILRGDVGMTWMGSLRTLGIMIGVVALFNAALLIAHPSQLGIVIEVPEEDEDDDDVRVIEDKDDNSEIEEQLLDEPRSQDETVESKSEGAISFWKAWLIPGVIPFAACIACVKCATYGMLFWLPSYADKELEYDETSISIIAIAYDVGTMFGSIILGKLTDLMHKKRSPVAFFGLLIGAGLFLMVVFFHDSGKYLLYVIIFFVGFFVGGIFNIVAATAATDLANSDTLKGNESALCTVSGILDGSGSLGAAFGSLVISAVSKISWNWVFIFLTGTVLFSSIPIFWVFMKEMRELLAIRNRSGSIIRSSSRRSSKSVE